ncbi:MAG: BrnT family toxin [Eubacteriales bacterium]|nr:BrnT family toxin [Eubacteriales bacterium]
MITFTLAGMTFEYNEEKNRKNIRKHGISFKNAARVFFDYDRIEFFDEEHSDEEERFDTIGDISAGKLGLNEAAARIDRGTVIGNVEQSIGKVNEILFVVYTERIRLESNGSKTEITRLISARLATNFERGLYYGKYE